MPFFRMQEVIMEVTMESVVCALFALLNYARIEDDRARAAGVDEDQEVFSHVIKGPGLRLIEFRSGP